MAFLRVRWLVTLTWIVHLFLPVCALSHAHQFLASHTSHPASRRDAQNFTTPTNTTSRNTTFTNVNGPACEFNPHTFRTVHSPSPMRITSLTRIAEACGKMPVWGRRNSRVPNFRNELSKTPRAS